MDDGRYLVSDFLGDGTFGRVLLAKDLKRDRKPVAIKVIRDVKRYLENARIEAEILDEIRKGDPNRTSRTRK